jgi:hypothetical protein
MGLQRMFFKQMIACILLGSICASVDTEGCFQTGLDQSLSDFTALTYLQKVDVVSTGEVINISLFEAVDSDDISVEILDPDSVSFYGSEIRNSNYLSGYGPFNARLAMTSPLTYTTTKTGSFTVTETQGEIEKNQKLSQARAKSVMDCLVSKAVASDRLESIGFGESKRSLSNRIV